MCVCAERENDSKKKEMREGEWESAMHVSINWESYTDILYVYTCIHIHSYTHTYKYTCTCSTCLMLGTTRPLGESTAIPTLCAALSITCCCIEIYEWVVTRVIVSRLSYSLHFTGHTIVLFITFHMTHDCTFEMTRLLYLTWHDYTCSNKMSRI